MDAIRINKKIESDEIHINGLAKYKGQNAEIIVLFNDASESLDKENEGINFILNLVNNPVDIAKSTTFLNRDDANAR